MESPTGNSFDALLERMKPLEEARRKRLADPVEAAKWLARLDAWNPALSKGSTALDSRADNSRPSTATE